MILLIIMSNWDLLPKTFHRLSLNRLDMKEEWIERVQSGFDKVAMEQGGTAYTYFGNKSYTVAAKTGTAEAFYDGPNRLDYSEPKKR